MDSVFPGRTQYSVHKKIRGENLDPGKFFFLFFFSFLGVPALFVGMDVGGRTRLTDCTTILEYRPTKLYTLSRLIITSKRSSRRHEYPCSMCFPCTRVRLTGFTCDKTLIAESRVLLWDPSGAYILSALEESGRDPAEVRAALV